MGQETSDLTCSVTGCRFLVQSKLWNNVQQWLACLSIREPTDFWRPSLLYHSSATFDLDFWYSENISEKNQAYEFFLIHQLEFIKPDLFLITWSLHQTVLMSTFSYIIYRSEIDLPIIRVVIIVHTDKSCCTSERKR